MNDQKVLDFLAGILENRPGEWLRLTTHRLDIYNESGAKTEFLEQFEELFENSNYASSALINLPTAYDYIRLGHPLSSVLEWAIAKLNKLAPADVISFSSRTMPVLAVLRKNTLENRNTRILYTEKLPAFYDLDLLSKVYGYSFEHNLIKKGEDIPEFDGITLFISQESQIGKSELKPNVDFCVNIYEQLGSVIIINTERNKSYVSAVQHVRRRESIAMTPANCLVALEALVSKSPIVKQEGSSAENKKRVLDAIRTITGTETKPLLGSSGLSIQYAITMGLIHDAQESHPGRNIKIIIPPNCYGGTNDQARRVAACFDNVDIVDLPVDRDNDMVQSTAYVLDQAAHEEAVPFIIVEIPTNPRVEVPNLEKLAAALSKKRKTPSGGVAIDPVFIIDQTFCPNIQFLRDDSMFSHIQTLSYVSGSKFPSGGRCTAGYCVANTRANSLIHKIETQLVLCDNEATDLQVKILAEQMPSMNQRIRDAYRNTREFVDFIREILPEAKINFVSEELAKEGFMPSVFSLDLPTKGNTHEERESYKRALNHKLIKLMISAIPDESKYCVSYGQLKGCYWTIPATSTQGTTKEEDKDYIARVALSPDMDLELHKKVFAEFVQDI